MQSPSVESTYEEEIGTSSEASAEQSTEITSEEPSSEKDSSKEQNSSSNGNNKPEDKEEPSSEESEELTSSEEEYASKQETSTDGNAPIFRPNLESEDNPFETSMETEIDQRPVEDFISEGEDRPGEGIHF